MGSEKTEQRLSSRMVAAQHGDAAACRALLRDCVPIIAAIANSREFPGILSMTSCKTRF